MRSWLISHRRPFKVDTESNATNARMSWMKFYFPSKIPGHWQPGLLTNFQLWKYKVSAFLNKVTCKTFKMYSDHSESDSSMKIRLYPRLISLVLFWTASFRRCSRWRCTEWNCKHGRELTKMQWNLQDKVDLEHLLKERDHCCQWLVK